jgi:hypothetical protein
MWVVGGRLTVSNLQNITQRAAGERFGGGSGFAEQGSFDSASANPADASLRMTALKFMFISMGWPAGPKSTQRKVQPRTDNRPP